MDAAPKPLDKLFALLKTLDGRAFRNYRQLHRCCYSHERFVLRFDHIQGSPGANPASMCRLTLNMAVLGLEGHFLKNLSRKIATADYLLRVFAEGVDTHAHQNHGDHGSGSYQPLMLPPQVLQRNLVRFDGTNLYLSYYVSLPGSHDNRILGRQAIFMFDGELSKIVRSLRQSVNSNVRLVEHCNVVEDMVTLQNRLGHYGLVGFVGDGAILPRASGVSQAPLKKGAVPFRAPDAMAVEVDLPNAGKVRGLGIQPGVNVVIGGAFQGKTTLLDALASGVYPHIPGDGRERVAIRPDAVFITTEQGRSIKGVDISGFIKKVPGRRDTRKFFSDNASGSTSQAASIIESVQAGSKLLIIDEDSSAANFLIKDQILRQLIPEDVVTPFFDRVRELYAQWGVSTLIVVGGSSEYLGVAHHVLAMRNYRPVCMTDQVRQLSLPSPCDPQRPLTVGDQRHVLSGNFNPSFRSRRLGKTLSVRIKPLRLQEKILEYGNQRLDLTHLDAVVDPFQVIAIGYALLLARDQFGETYLSPSDLARALDEHIENEGLDSLLPSDMPQLCLARPRLLELAGAMNRLRNLEVKN